MRDPSYPATLDDMRGTSRMRFNLNMYGIWNHHSSVSGKTSANALPTMRSFFILKVNGYREEGLERRSTPIEGRRSAISKHLTLPATHALTRNDPPAIHRIEPREHFWGAEPPQWDHGAPYFHATPGRLSTSDVHGDRQRCGRERNPFPWRVQDAREGLRRQVIPDCYWE